MYNKSVLLSTQPRWCFEIINGKNTELRKTKPKLQPPFKVLLYCTKASVKGRYFVGALGFNSDELYRTPDGKIKYGDSIELMACGSGTYSKDNFLNGKVIGEFICDSIDLTYDILTNPPYKYAMEFVLRALELLQSGCKCYMFLKLTFLESEKRYKELFAKQPPKAIYVFSKRVLCAKNGEFERMREGGGSAVAYAWFVWQKGYAGKTEVSWI